jgi:hypothetical protein
VTDDFAATRRKMLIELRTERIRITSSVKVMVTSMACGSWKSRENRVRLARSDLARVASDSSISASVRTTERSARASIDESVGIIDISHSLARRDAPTKR